ncbi:MAG TPA: hypothetical protein VEP91_10050, partial [Solirubrobacterales bacterium]|nr:hypothetical protein [Solirubrobacterales bacterium]
PVEVSLDLAAAGVSLNPDQTYYFRAVAAPAVASEDTIEWEKPAVGGGTQTFHTSSSQIPSDPPAEAATGEGGTAQPAPPIRRKHHGKRHHRRSGRVAISRARPAL